MARAKREGAPAQVTGYTIPYRYFLMAGPYIDDEMDEDEADIAIDKSLGAFAFQYAFLTLEQALNAARGIDTERYWWQVMDVVQLTIPAYSEEDRIKH